MFGSILVALAVSVPVPEVFAEVAGARYGRIIIEGNDETPDHFIHAHLRLRPGQKVNAAEFRAARERLRASGAFHSNPWLGAGPVVQLLPNELDSAYIDVRVRIREKPLNWLKFGLSDLALAVAFQNGAAMGREIQWLRYAGERHFTGK